MRTDEFDYYLPEELIAQTPLENRSSSRLLVLHKKTGQIEHRKFSDIINYLSKGDALVINDTKVIPARLIGEKEDTGAVIELLLLKNINGDVWECLAKPQKRLHIDTIISFGKGKLKAKVKEVLADGITRVELIYTGILMEVLESLGTMPLPPYIHQKLKVPSPTCNVTWTTSIPLSFISFNSSSVKCKPAEVRNTSKTKLTGGKQ